MTDTGYIEYEEAQLQRKEGEFDSPIPIHFYLRYYLN